MDQYKSSEEYLVSPISNKIPINAFILSKVTSFYMVMYEWAPALNPLFSFT